MGSACIPGGIRESGDTHGIGEIGVLGGFGGVGGEVGGYGAVNNDVDGTRGPDGINENGKDSGANWVSKSSEVCENGEDADVKKAVTPAELQKIELMQPDREFPQPATSIFAVAYVNCILYSGCARRENDRRSDVKIDEIRERINDCPDCDFSLLIPIPVAVDSALLGGWDDEKYVPAPPVNLLLDNCKGSDGGSDGDSDSENAESERRATDIRRAIFAT
jgi:hypothetical protein